MSEKPSRNGTVACRGIPIYCALWRIRKGVETGILEVKTPRNTTVNLEVNNMPRMSKRRKEEWAFFLNERGRISYNQLCRRCIHGCKQSFQAIVVECRKYKSKRAKEDKCLW